MSQAHSLTDDVTHELLSNSRRRHLLALLSETGQADVEELARQIAAREANVASSRVSEDRHQHVSISLVHKHLPKLAKHDVVQYDSDTKTVVLMDVFSDLQRGSGQSDSNAVLQDFSSGN